MTANVNDQIALMIGRSVLETISLRAQLAEAVERAEKAEQALQDKQNEEAS